MLNFYDIAYLLGLGVAAPYWLIVPKARRKVLKALRHRMGHGERHAPGNLRLLIHAVSMGEINAVRTLVQRLELARPDIHFIITTTTDTGYERATQLYGAACRIHLVRYPLDFSWSVRRALDSLQPTIVALLELELWPNFLKECQRRNIPVILINGRMSQGSYRQYRAIRPLMKRMLRSLIKLCVQDKTYANWFTHLGADPGSIRVTGTMKFDTATVSDQVQGADDMAGLLGLKVGVDPIWVCGSTGPGEETLILDEYRKLLSKFARLRLVLVPRHPDRFDQVARVIEEHKFKVIRRSKVSAPPSASDAVPAVVLGDTMGELRRFYSLADVVFVGRTLVDLGSRQHGSDMIEPAALAKPVIVGPYTGNFSDAMIKLRADEAILEVRDAGQLRHSVMKLIGDPQLARVIGGRARAVVLREQGATDRHAEAILDLLKQHEPKAMAAAAK